MKTWIRAPIAGECCGRCGNPIPRGAPELVITRAGMRARFRRCETCAGEPAPADLPPLAEAPIGTPAGDENR
jgi:hypothetical protein